MNEFLAQKLNILGDFCGKRDLDALDRKSLQKEYGLDQVDVMVLFGGSILAGADLLARAIRERLAAHFLIVGGAGHTTRTLRRQVGREYPSIQTAGLSEAEIFQACLKEVYGCQADYLETRSTNCGNNITNMLDLLKEKEIPFHSIILCQDATMQRRMDAGFRKYMPGLSPAISFASYRARVIAGREGLAFAEDIHGMWSMDSYIRLLMGEIPRLTDDQDGYGPRGKDFIAHVPVPDRVTEAFEALKEVYGDMIRPANSEYAS